jgi:hypothetical protein
MLLLSPARVALGLRTDTLSEAQKAGLVIAGVILTAVLGSLSAPRGFSTWGNVLYLVLYVAGMAAGIWACYRANEEGDGRGFVERYVCLSVPLTALMYLGYLTLFYGAFFVLRERPGFETDAYAATVQPYFGPIALALLFAYFAALRVYIRRVAAPSAS